MTLFNSSPADVIQSCKSIPDKAAINLPHVVNRVTDPLPPPTECPFCAGEVRLVNNAGSTVAVSSVGRWRMPVVAVRGWDVIPAPQFPSAHWLTKPPKMLVDARTKRLTPSGRARVQACAAAPTRRCKRPWEPRMPTFHGWVSRNVRRSSKFANKA